MQVNTPNDTQQSETICGLGNAYYKADDVHHHVIARTWRVIWHTSYRRDKGLGFRLECAQERPRLTGGYSREADELEKLFASSA